MIDGMGFGLGVKSDGYETLVFGKTLTESCLHSFVRKSSSPIGMNEAITKVAYREENWTGCSRLSRD